jgi:hypothetical protein
MPCAAKNSKKLSKLKVLYAAMARSTKEKCKPCFSSIAAGSCCGAETCKSVLAFAREEHGVVLPITSHSKLPLMGENGCTVPAYLRPMCAMYICDKYLFSDPAFNGKYFALRDKIVKLEFEIYEP